MLQEEGKNQAFGGTGESDPHGMEISSLEVTNTMFLEDYLQ